ncbi:MAG: hypothetical protein AUK55_01385 [Syntrophobacteraceae bacterium CG2_30_61_12]|nr:MAG: hypothetical protein AUK55_01385 [Syntrophobacteraceae bacterium CG2_30_61_12]
MAKAIRDRVRDWRDRKSQEGGRSLSAWLEPDTARMFQTLQEHFGDTTSPLVARSIEALHALTFECRTDEKPTLTAPAAAGTEQTVVMGSPRATPTDKTAAKTAVTATAAAGPTTTAEAAGPAAETAGDPLEALQPRQQVAEPDEPVAAAASSADDPILAEMVAGLKSGVSFKEIRGTLLLRWLNAMKTLGISYEEMAERLNRAEIPTLAGKGRWQAGMIPAFLLLSGLR